MSTNTGKDAGPDNTRKRKSGAQRPGSGDGDDKRRAGGAKKTPRKERAAAAAAAAAEEDVPGPNTGQSAKEGGDGDVQVGRFNKLRTDGSVRVTFEKEAARTVIVARCTSSGPDNPIRYEYSQSAGQLRIFCAGGGGGGYSSGPSVMTNTCFGMGSVAVNNGFLVIENRAGVVQSFAGNGNVVVGNGNVVGSLAPSIATIDGRIIGPGEAIEHVRRFTVDGTWTRFLDCVHTTGASSVDIAGVHAFIDHRTNVRVTLDGASRVTFTARPPGGADVPASQILAAELHVVANGASQFESETAPAGRLVVVAGGASRVMAAGRASVNVTCGGASVVIAYKGRSCHDSWSHTSGVAGCSIRTLDD